MAGPAPGTTSIKSLTQECCLLTLWGLMRSMQATRTVESHTMKASADCSYRADFDLDVL